MSYIILFLVGGKSMLAAMITHFFMFTLLTLNIFSFQNAFIERHIGGKLLFLLNFLRINQNILSNKWNYLI